MGSHTTSTVNGHTNGNTFKHNTPRQSAPNHHNKLGPQSNGHHQSGSLGSVTLGTFWGSVRMGTHNTHSHCHCSEHNVNTATQQHTHTEQSRSQQWSITTIVSQQCHYTRQHNNLSSVTQSLNNNNNMYTIVNNGSIPIVTQITMSHNNNTKYTTHTTHQQLYISLLSTQSLGLITQHNVSQWSVTATPPSTTMSSGQQM